MTEESTSGYIRREILARLDQLEQVQAQQAKNQEDLALILRSLNAKIKDHDTRLKKLEG